ncbi:Mfa1 fimbrilin C-terminal domain-containing protein [Paraprevotella clara]|uniref:Mfa1 fimbrilin C-terminal domain-containing protein n=1 Tax=Paraprevotella clara TaxID=454154 RepID=UPI003467778C
MYPGGAENYLGRYGVLRNNWYDISVTAIKNIGSSTVEPVTGNTIDKLESYISVKINILAWAKRSQSVVL